MPSKPKIPAIQADNGELGSVFICAVRYCLGRCTYMPKLVTDFILPYIPYLENRTLSVMMRDIQEAPSYGMDCDRTMWMYFLQKLQYEADKRSMRNNIFDENNKQPNR